MSEVVKTPGITELSNAQLKQGGTNGEEQLTSADSQMEFSTVKTHLQSLVNDWEQVREKAKENRKTRDVDFSVEVLRREGILDEDETMIPMRVIDTNITRELPPYVNYLKNSRRVAIFQCISNPDIRTDKLELEFTRGMTYAGWETAHFKVLDGSCTHGWDACEVVFDSSKPLNVGIEHVGHDNLFWPRTSINIQQAVRIIRTYDYSIIELRKFVKKHGWNVEQVNKVINARKSGKKEAETNKVYKVMFKEEGIVYSGWFSLEDGCDDWLKSPAPHYIGIDEQDPTTGQWTPKLLTDYPVFILPYRESEKKKLVEKHGRVFLDGAKQEGQTSIFSSYVNGLTRATKILASPKQDDGTGNSVKEIADTPLEGGAVLNKPMDFYNAPYPDSQILHALEYFDNANSNETSQVNFAVVNRQDSRKTAKEVSLAEQQNSMLNSVQLTLFSTYVRSVYSLCWLVVQSQALQGNVSFLLTLQDIPSVNPLDGQPMIDPNTGQPVVEKQWLNDAATLKETYDVRAAGDVDVIQKNERVQQMKQDWPVIMNTALANRFLSDLIRLSYPDKGDEYAKILEEGQKNEVQVLGGLVAGFTTVLQTLISNNPDLISSLTPENQQKLAQMIQTGEQVKNQAQVQQKVPQ